MPSHKKREPGDPLVDEIRAIRQALADQFGNDVDRLCDEFARVGSAFRRKTGVKRQGSRQARSASRVTKTKKAKTPL